MARILIVDDEKPVQALLKRLLALHGHQVDAVNDGGEAIDQLQEKRYDLMLIDRCMPNIAGPETIAIIRSSPKFRTLKIVMLTGASMTKEIDEVYRLGINGYLLKPLDVKKLLETVEFTLGAQGAGYAPPPAWTVSPKNETPLGASFI